MPKGALSETKISGEGSELRELLRQCELTIGKGRRAGAETLALIRRIDEIVDVMEGLRGSEMDLRPEEGRLASLQELLRSNAGKLVGEIRSVGGLKAARSREDPLPPEDHWWWYLDVLERTRLRTRLRRGLTYLLVGAAVIAVGLFAYEYLVPRDPILEAKVGHISSGEQYVSQGEIEAAVAEYELAAELDSTDADVQTWLGVLYERLGRSAEALAAFERARSLVSDEALFLATRGLHYIQVGDAENALNDGQASVAINPDLAQAHLVLANAYQALGDVIKALEEFEITGDLAQKAGNDTLYVIARTQQAMLLQSPPMFSPEQTPATE
jgi:tetratricopeptide (TPR) repeat protein